MEKVIAIICALDTALFGWCDRETCLINRVWRTGKLRAVTKTF